MKISPTVSIITPCFNAEKTLENTVASVLAQSYLEWELILIDDHSTDTTYTQAMRYAEADPRIKAVRMETNGGAAKARNRGIEMAQGRYIAFIDADDLWHTDKLKTQIALMEANNWALSFTSYKRIDGVGKPLSNVGVPHKATYKKLLKTNYIGCSTAIYDSKIVGKVLMPDIRKRQDFALWLKLLKICEFAHGIREPLTTYRVHKNSLSSNKANSARYNWHIYRNIEKLGLLRSCYYFAHYATRGFLRSKMPNIALLLGFLHRSSHQG
ncbi:glycosyl transferase group 2 family protein [Alcanivorax hongdengensis A-11-3]|uniref:Glycosyl transferase group 2 family protein n=1 Tax=Alcanivorax hongdengensis A-11-3 TaxID=1177179 RepID=L0W8M4_9GAMM|nr:glycosyltransferase family 2 protein [Alcanivorax hongdengensis]EKF73276.1 glycosyl transferase group 2 family protein [Alcanivorax hongdengensis A-11-3]